MRIGISVVTHSGQNIWENGLGQNVVFLALLLQRLHFVRSVLLIDVGDQNVMPDQVDTAQLGLRLMRTHDATDEVDVIIEMAGALDPQWLALQRARGKKVVYYCAGQPYVGTIESPVFGKSDYFPPVGRCDEIWLLPKDESLVPFQRVLHRCPVHIAPYLWHPRFLEQRIAQIGETGLRFGWQGDASPTGLRVAIFEPNISVVKTSSISMLACDEAYRAEPASVSMMHVLNTLHLKDHPTMLYLANSLNLVKEHKAVFLGRHDIVGFMAQNNVNAVMSHQWQNDQNYSYLDTLYGDYPLIHNSPWLRSFGAGYYYDGFDAAAGGRQLLIAAADHHAGLDDYRNRSRQVFQAVDPFNQINIDHYGRLLKDLCAGNARSIAA
jgi:hypothetical protein